MPASLSKGAEFSVFCITCHASRKWGSSRCVLHLFDIGYHPVSPGTDSGSPFTLHGTAGGVSLKQTQAPGREMPGTCVRRGERR